MKRAPFFRLLLLVGFLASNFGPSSPAQDTVPEWQAIAVKKYPQLAVQGSDLNTRFVQACKDRRSSTPAFFSNPKWPLLLAEELAKENVQPVPAEADSTPAEAPVAAAATATPASPATPAAGATTEYEAANIPAAVGLDSASFRWWAAADTQVRGVLVLIPGRGGDGRGMASDRAWQKLAGDNGFGILACCLRNPAADTGSFQSDPNGAVSEFLDHTLDAVLEQNGQKIKKPPLAFWGHSAGGNITELYATHNASRVIGAVLTHAPHGPGEHSAGKDDVPLLVLVGKKDKPEWVSYATEKYDQGHAAHALWTLVANPNQGHEVGNTVPLAITYLAGVIHLRLPAATGLASGPAKPKKLVESAGWLGDPVSYEVAAYGQFKGKKKDAIWLPDEATAQAWQKHLQGS